MSNPRKLVYFPWPRQGIDSNTIRVDIRDPNTHFEDRLFNKVSDASMNNVEFGMQANVVLEADGKTVKEIIGPIMYNLVNPES